MLLWEPTEEETKEIMQTRAARGAFLNDKAMLYSQTVLGTKYHIAFFQTGLDTEVQEVQCFCALNPADLQDILLT